MFDIGWGELVVIGIVALIVIGPKELPGVLRSLGQWMGKIKTMAGEFQGQFREAMREAEMTDLKKQADDLSATVTDFTNLDPMANVQKDMERAFSPESDAAKITPADKGEAAAGAQSTPAAQPETPLPEIKVALPDMPGPITEKDFAPAEPAPPRKAGSGA